jgi:hypothetical protein
VSIALYMDEHVPAAITAGLRSRGVDVLTVQEDGRSGFDDLDLLERAAVLGRVMFFQDTDLLRLAAAKQRSGEAFVGVIYSHQASMSVGDCIDELQLIVEACALEELANLVQYLPLR